MNNLVANAMQGKSLYVDYNTGYVTRDRYSKEDKEYVAFLEKSQKELGELIQNLCWNEDRFIRGFTEDGETIGKRTDPEANMWLNPQSWSVISGLASGEQADKALDKVYEQLNTEYGAVLMDPPYHAHPYPYYGPGHEA